MNITKLVLPTASVVLPRCSICFHYLSHTIALMLGNGAAVCASCQLRVLAEHEVVESCYSVIAKHCKFKCRNHFGGCNQMIDSESDHEIYCPENLACCPKCTYVGDSVQIEYHFENTHPEFLVKEEFEIENRNGFTTTLLYKKDAFLFPIYIVIDDDCLKIKAVNLFKNPNLSKYEFQMISSVKGVVDIHKKNGEFLPKKDIHRYVQINLSKLVDFFKEPLINCKLIIEVDNALEEINERAENTLTFVRNHVIEDMESYHISIEEQIELLKAENVNLTHQINQNSIEDVNTVEALQKYVQIVLPSILVCSNCKATLKTPFNICTRNHPVCSSCKSNVCNKCEKETQFKSSDRIGSLEIHCDWQGCNEVSKFSNYLTHKQQCPFRQYKCPDLSCNLTAKLSEFSQHWHYVKPNLEMNGTIRYKTGEKLEFYWIIPCNREFVHVKIRKVSGMETKIKIDEQYMVLNENYEIKLFGKIGSRVEYLDSLKQHGQYKVLKYKHHREQYQIVASLKN